MTKQEALKIINKVGEDFGWQMGKVGANYENGYMKAIRDVKNAFEHIVDSNKMVVTNADRIRNMSDEELVKFINYDYPSCDEYCDDYGEGCAFRCTHNLGEDIILQWMKEKVE